MTKITIHAEMIDYKYEPGGYIVYIFRNLESKRWDTKYFMCTQVPNWDQPPIKLRDIGYLTIQEVVAGVDTWYDVLNGQQVPYLYNNIYLVKFLPQKPADSENYTMLFSLNSKYYYFMGVIGDKLTQALEEKYNNVENFIWKFPKKEIDGKTVQEEIRLVDATPEQLKTFYNHCLSMLYNTDSKRNPGRFHLKEIVNEQRHKCNVELYIRYVEGKYKNLNDRKAYPRFLYLQDLRTLLANSGVTAADYKNISVEDIMTTVPEEFRDVTIDDVVSGCLDTLGFFDRSHISLNFIADLGLWPTKQEKKELEEIDPKTGKNRDWITVIKERHGLRSDLPLKVSPIGLNYTELRAMFNLKSKKYSELTTDQLVLLRNKVLFRFEQKIDLHIHQWEERIRQIQVVAESREIDLEK